MTTEAQRSPDVLEHLAASPRGDAVLERVLEAKFAAASDRESDLQELDAQLGRLALGPTAEAWRALIQLEILSRRGAETVSAAQEHLFASLDGTTPRTRSIARIEAARLLWERGSLSGAWELARDTPFPAASANDDADSPMVETAVLSLIKMAAAAGAWPAHDAFARQADALWTSIEPCRSKLALCQADSDFLRGRYQSALRRAESLNDPVAGSLRVWATCVRLAALTATYAKGGDPATQERLREARDAARTVEAEPAAGDAIVASADDHRLRERLRRLLELASDRLDPRGSSPGDPAGLYRSALGLRPSDRRTRAFATARERCEEMLRTLLPDDSAQAWLEARLLWCRIVVDAPDAARLAFAEKQLGEIAERAGALGLLPVRMHALHVRARACLLIQPEALRDALFYAGTASALAEQLLNENAPDAAEATPLQRALLHGLLPVLDGGLALLVAVSNLGSQHSARAREPAVGGRITELATHDEPAAARWRYGWAIWDHVERSQELALADARGAYAGTGRRTGRIVRTPSQVPIGRRLSDLQSSLPERDAVLQYFVASPYVIALVFGADFFDWCASTVTEDPDASAREAIDACDRALGPWKTADANTRINDAESAAASRLREWLAPAALVALLRRRRVRHVRVVPHDVLYRLPLDRILVRLAGLDGVHFSYAPTATEACRPAPPSAGGRARLTIVVGAGLAEAAAERAVVERAAGGFLGFARTDAIDGAACRVERVAGVQGLHVICHGHAGSGDSPPFLEFDASNPDARLTLSEAAQLPLASCRLAVLASCWSGWMDHSRERPVQGFPQALRDAGVVGVIAPAVPIPDSLGPVFAGLLYRALRFLPAARALGLCVALLRSRRLTPVARGSPADVDLRRYGGPDAFQLRYVGPPELTVTSALPRRMLAALAFWVWLAWTRLRALASPITLREPAASPPTTPP